jgi:Glycosyl transferase family 2
MSQFVYLSGQPIDIHPNQIVAVIKQRTEALRLPYLLTYYRGIGVDRFLVIDNGSTDGSRDMQHAAGVGDSEVSFWHIQDVQLRRVKVCLSQKKADMGGCPPDYRL